LKITPEQYEILKTVSVISKNSEFKAAPIKQIIEEITKKRNVKNGAVRKLICVLNKNGYLENPLRGCWKLSDKGLKILKELEKPEQNA
jgi:DNA-binding MarR family transcriptional regulator